MATHNFKHESIRLESLKAFQDTCKAFNVSPADLSVIYMETKSMEGAKAIFAKALPQIPLDDDGLRLLKYILNLSHPDPANAYPAKPAYHSSWPDTIGL